MGKRNYYFGLEPVDGIYRYGIRPMTAVAILFCSLMISIGLDKINNTLYSINASINHDNRLQARATTVMTAQLLKATDHDFKCDIAYDFTYPGETNYFIREISDIQKRNPFKAAEFSLTNCNRGK